MIPIGDGSFRILRVARAREVGQSYVTSAVTTSRAFWQSAQHYVREKPHVVLANGPGTAMPVIFSAFIGKIFGFNRPCKVIYVESVARTKHLSLSGWLCYHSRVCDAVFVMWEELAKTYPRAKFCGRIY